MSRSLGNFHFLQPLREEHRYNLQFCWRIREGVKLKAGSSRISNYIHAFWSQNLSYHLMDEESLLFVDRSNPVIEKAMDEHVLLNKHVQQIISLPELVTPHQLSELADILDNHIQYEEKVLFPYLTHSLTHAQLRDINQSLDRATSSLQQLSLYPDEFWKDPNASL